MNLSESQDKDSRAQELPAVEAFLNELNCFFHFDNELNLKVILDETVNWEVGIEDFSKILGPWVTNLKFEATLKSYSAYYGKIRGILRNFTKLNKLVVNNLEDAIYLDFPKTTIETLRIKRYNCYMTAEHYETLQTWKKLGLTLIAGTSSYYPPKNHTQDLIVFPKIKFDLMEFIENYSSKNLSFRQEQNVLELDEVGFDDVECFLGNFKMLHFSNFAVQLEQLKNLKTFRIQPQLNGCFFNHQKTLKLKHIQRIEFMVFPSNEKLCLKCLKKLKKSCTDFKTFQIKAGSRFIPALIEIASSNLQRLKLQFFEHSLNMKLNFPHLEELDVCEGKTFKDPQNDFFKGCDAWPQMLKMKTLTVGHKMYLDEDILRVLAEKCPNVEMFTAMDNDFLTEDLKVLAETLWETAKIIKRSAYVIF